jgi:hypothetical protein
MFNFEHYILQHCELHLYLFQGQLPVLNITDIEIRQQALGDEAMVRQPSVHMHVKFLADVRIN